MKKILVPLYGAEIAPRFDLATEVLLLFPKPEGRAWEERILVVSHPSAEELCRLILKEEVETVICGGIEDEYYQYLNWKGIFVLDSVAGLWNRIPDRLQKDDLKAGELLYDQIQQ